VTPWALFQVCGQIDEHPSAIRTPIPVWGSGRVDNKQNTALEDKKPCRQKKKKVKKKKKDNYDLK
jgi:hypothetical protein